MQDCASPRRNMVWRVWFSDPSPPSAYCYICCLRFLALSQATLAFRRRSIE